MVGAATGAAVAQPAAPRAEITRADQTLPAGFYPGQGTPDVRRRYPEPFLQFLQRNAATIDEIDQGAAAGRANPSQRHCVGAALSECVSSMAAVIAIASTFSPIDEALEAPLGSPGVDINGRAIEQTPILRAYLGDSDVHLVVLQMKGGQVVGVSLDLSGPISLAHSFESYEKTKVYDLALAAMPGGCDLGGRIGFYRFIENNMKSNGLGSGNAADPDDADVITDSTIAYFGRLCGRRLTIREHMMRTISSGLSMSYKLEVD